MKEALKLCISALDAVASAAVNYQLRAGEQCVLDARDAIASAEAALARPEPEPVAWQHRRPRCDDDGMLIGHGDWEEGRGLGNWPHRALYAGSAPAQSASPFAPCGRGTGTCSISSQTCGRDGCEADVVPADQLRD